MDTGARAGPEVQAALPEWPRPPAHSCLGASAPRHRLSPGRADRPGCDFYFQVGGATWRRREGQQRPLCHKETLLRSSSQPGTAGHRWGGVGSRHCQLRHPGGRRASHSSLDQGFCGGDGISSLLIPIQIRGGAGGVRGP